MGWKELCAGSLEDRQTDGLDLHRERSVAPLEGMGSHKECLSVACCHMCTHCTLIIHLFCSRMYPQTLKWCLGLVPLMDNH